MASLLSSTVDTTNTGTSTGTSTASTGSTGTTGQNMSSLQQMLSQMFGAGAMNQFQDIPGLVKAETTQGLQNINAGETAANTDVSNTLAARGLAFSPYAGTAMAQPAMQAQSQKSQLMTQMPLLANSLKSQDLSQLMNANSNSSGTSNQTSTGSILSDITGLAGAVAAFKP